MMDRHDLENRIRTVLDGAGSKGKYDFLTVFHEGELTNDIVEYLSAPYRNKVDHVAAPESTGFILGAMMAAHLGAGFAALRKGGKLPYDDSDIRSASYSDYSGQSKRVELHSGVLGPGDRVLLVDDWTETTETIRACIRLLAETGARLEGIAVIGGDQEQLRKLEDKNLRYIMLDT